MSPALRRALSLQESLYWLEIQLELLAADERALRKMRKILQVHGDGSGGFELDVELLMIEIERVMVRLGHWEAVVARIKARRN